ncbi:MAG: trimethylamine methyltransferase family protein, partial [Myxococcales bacterium]|nr:trimethylamine methyltransferase family protein [Myxococcales bacterium]
MIEDSAAQKSSVKPRRGGRKSGGRAGRHAERKKGTVGMAVRAGIEGGAYKPLSDRDVERIHDTALNVLANIGIADPIPEILEYALPKGCTVDENGRLRFPRSLVEDLIDISAK